jgi:ribosomal protein S18 acetylase RimI-like enzyme
MAARGDIVVRPARPEDEPAILDLWATAYGKPPDPDRARLLSLLKERDAPVLVAEHAGRILGSLICVADGWRGNVYRLAVAPDQQRGGIARRLVEEGERKLRAAGIRRVTALVDSRDEAAVGLWSAAGYEPEPTTARFVKNLGPTGPAV